MNCGTIGFLMNAYAVEALPERLAAAEETAINPLSMRAENTRGKVTEALAINEVSLLRQGPQAAKLRVLIDGRERLEELVCDGRWWWRRRRGPRLTTIRRTGRSCRSGRMCWR